MLFAGVGPEIAACVAYAEIEACGEGGDIAMRWFKHMTSSSDDEKLSRLKDTYGLEGYGFWWSVVEIIAAKVGPDGETSVEFSPKKWGNSLGISPKKFRMLAEYCADLKLFSVEFSEKTIRIDMPNILKFRDEYTKKSGQNPDKLRSKKQIQIQSTDTDTDKTLPLPLAEGEGGSASANSPDASASGPSPGKKPDEPRSVFVPPEPAEVEAYCHERQNGISGREFCDFYAAKGWMVGKTRMRDWKAAVRTWEHKRKEERQALERTRASPYAMPLN